MSGDGPGRFAGRVAIITGAGAPDGIGVAVARHLVDEGARVVLGATSERVFQRVEELGAAAVGVVADLTVDGAASTLVDAAVQRWGRVDILVNNAGATWAAPMEEHPLEAWDKVMNLNVRSVFLMSQAVGRASMIPRRAGRIINIASIAGLSGSIDVRFIAYGTSKGAVVNFTRTLAGEWGRYGITVNALAPGFFPSKMTQGVIAAHGSDKLAAQAPLQRLGDDDDLKGAALLFASAAGKHITGQILAVDGGVSAVHGGA